MMRTNIYLMNGDICVEAATRLHIDKMLLHHYLLSDHLIQSVLIASGEVLIN
jgi:hypothetical protein